MYNQRKHIATSAYWMGNPMKSVVSVVFALVALSIISSSAMAEDGFERDVNTVHFECGPKFLSPQCEKLCSEKLGCGEIPNEEEMPPAEIHCSQSPYGCPPGLPNVDNCLNCEEMVDAFDDEYRFERLESLSPFAIVTDVFKVYDSYNGVKVRNTVAPVMVYDLSGQQIISKTREDTRVLVFGSDSEIYPSFGSDVSNEFVRLRIRTKIGSQGSMFVNGEEVYGEFRELDKGMTYVYAYVFLEQDKSLEVRSGEVELISFTIYSETETGLTMDATVSIQ